MMKFKAKTKKPARSGHWAKLALLSAAVLTLQACGGGGDDEDAVVPHGAIALNEKTGAAAIATNLENGPLATQQAIVSCGWGDCQVVLTFSGFGTCGALAAGSNRQWGAASGASKAQAEQAAVANCTSKGGRNCAIPAGLPGQCM